jgi:ankyrin repeat protein
MNQSIPIIKTTDKQKAAKINKLISCKDFNNAFVYSIIYKNKEYFDSLIDNPDVNINLNYDGGTALWFAVFNHDMYFIESLLERNAIVNSFVLTATKNIQILKILNLYRKLQQ